MPRPTSKDELLTAIEVERGKLEALLDSLPPDQMTLSGVVGAWSVKDVPGVVPSWVARRGSTAKQEA
jgi:hypothetical protein